MRTDLCGRPGEPAESPLIYLSTEFIRAKEYLEAIVGSTSDAIITTDMRGRVIYFSPGAERMTGRPFARSLGMPVWRLYEGGAEEARTVMRLLLRDGSISDYETALLSPNGTRVSVSMSASLIRDRQGRVIGTLGISKDISRRVELERRLRMLSMTDELTGLNNQRCFLERLPAEVNRALRLGHTLSLAMLDLDRFKEANDRWGHVEGDRILRDTAVIIRDSIRRDVDMAFRYGGDEFVVLLPGLEKRPAANVARRIRRVSSQRPYARLVTLSIGIASLRRDESPMTFLHRADGLMYRAKRRRKARASAPPSASAAD